MTRQEGLTPSCASARLISFFVRWPVKATERIG
jgi:hypothetical protein